MRARLIGFTAALLLGVVGAGALVTHVRGIEARAEAGERHVAVLLVQRPVAEGTPVEAMADAVGLAEVPVRVAAQGGVASLDQLAGKVATADLQPGEQVLESRFATPAELVSRGQIDVPPDLHQVTVALEPQRAVGGALAAGDTVGVFVSLDEGEELGLETTHLTLHKVLVTRVQGDAIALGAGDGLEEPAADPAAPHVPAGHLLITLAVPAADAERLVFGAEHGRLWLSHEPSEATESGTQVQTTETIYP